MQRPQSIRKESVNFTNAVVPQTLLVSILSATYLLYYSQGLVTDIARSFAVSSSSASLAPAAALGGYAFGVAISAFIVRDLSDKTGLAAHLCFLVLAGLGAVFTGNFAALVTAFFAIGIGCSVTQRLVCCAAKFYSTKDPSRIVGWMITAGLFGIVLARATSPVIEKILGWRVGLLVGVVMAAVIFSLLLTNLPCLPFRQLPLQPRLSVQQLWKRYPEARRICLQMSLLFPVFTACWLTFPALLIQESYSVEPGSLALVSSFGVLSAFLVSKRINSGNSDRLATIGISLVMFSMLLLAADIDAPPHLKLVILEIGMQMTLVSNQVRIQALTSEIAVRGKLAAVVTLVSFAAGALGAGIVGKVAEYVNFSVLALICLFAAFFAFSVELFRMNNKNSYWKS